MVVRVEASVPESTQRDLLSRGHAVKTLGPGSDSGAVQIIQIEPSGFLRGATDPRSGGLDLLMGADR